MMVRKEENESIGPKPKLVHCHEERTKSIDYWVFHHDNAPALVRMYVLKRFDNFKQTIFSIPLS